MQVSPRRPLGRAVKAAATIAVAAAIAATSGCGGNFDAQTNQIYQPAVGTNNRDGQVYVLNALMVTDGQGSGTLVAGLVNTELDVDDQLTEVTASATNGNSLDVTLPSGGVELPAMQLVRLAQDPGAQVALSGNAADVGAGGSVNVTFTFDNAEAVTVDVPVVANTADYADVPIPTPTPTTTGSG